MSSPRVSTMTRDLWDDFLHFSLKHNKKIDAIGVYWYSNTAVTTGEYFKVIGSRWPLGVNRDTGQPGKLVTQLLLLLRTR